MYHFYYYTLTGFGSQQLNKYITFGITSDYTNV